MKRAAPIIALLVVVALIGVGMAVSGVPSGATPEPATSDYDFSRVDAAIERLMTTYGVDGASMKVARHGQVIYEGDFGTFDETTAVTIGSASKWMSVAALFTLIEDGTLSLDDRIDKYLDFFPEHSRGITLHQLVSHTSGLKRRTDCVQKYDLTLMQCVRIIAEDGVRAPPGVEFRYGGVSLHIAAGMAETATGRPWREIFKERIVEPLGLKHTQYGKSGLSENPGVAGNLITSSVDSLKFLQMILDEGEFEGRRILKPETIRLMEQGHTGSVKREGHLPSRHTKTPHDLYGYGVWRDIVDAEDNLLVGSSPGKFGAAPWIDRELDLAGTFIVEIKNGGEVAAARPDPAGIQFLVCDVIDAAENGARPKGSGPNPRCAMHLRRERAGF